MTKQLAKDIRQFAKENNMTVGNVLKMCDVNSSQLYNWQNGGYEASEETEMRVRRILALPLITFTKKIVSADHMPFPEVDEEMFVDAKDKALIRVIEMVCQSKAEESDKLEAIRFLLAK